MSASASAVVARALCRCVWLVLLVACGESSAAKAPLPSGGLPSGAQAGFQAQGPTAGTSSGGASAGMSPVAAGSGGEVGPNPNASSGHPLAIIGGVPAPGCANYFPEILKAEGISSFDVIELSQLERLPQYALAILPGVALTDEQAGALSEWVSQGGRLISLRPDPRLAELLGIGPKQGTSSGGYIQVDSERWGGVAAPTQFHGQADRYAALPGTRVEAALLELDRSVSGFPAVTLRESIGPGRGVAASFAYDLACSVILTRQGNPASVGQTELDAVPRSSELFAAFLDTENFEIPQADQQQRLFVNLLQHAGAERVPLPRLWYLPGGRKLAVVMTGDDHNASGTSAFFELLKTQSYSPAGCSQRDWSCARATSWVYSSVGSLKNGAAAALVADGFELGPHVAMERDGGCATWSSEADLLARFSARRDEFEQDYGIAPSDTNRSHCFVFADWDSQPKVEAELGIRLDVNYTPYALPGTKNRLGRLNGSAIPMRFTDTSGQVLDVYQLVSDMDYEYFDSGTSPSALGQAIGRLFDDALGANELVGFVGTHYDYSGGLEGDFRAALLGEVLERQSQGVALISARQLLDWLTLRDSASFDELVFDGQAFAFTLRVDPALPNPGLEAMLPAQLAGKHLTSLERSGSPVELLRTSTFHAVSYAYFGAIDGQYRARYQ